MKRLISTLALAFASASAFAQLPAGSIAPDFTVKDLNGTSYNLYTLLNSGKTVFIDVSAAWCAPCWNYHNSGALENLYKHHGPSGAPGVDATTTNDVQVFFIEGEATNTRAQLYGTSSGSSHATFSQGNWVTNTPYPIVDSNSTWTSAFNSGWQIGYFPTIYMVCRDHLVQEVGQLTETQLYAKATGVCPTYGPSNGDVKALGYTGKNYFLCGNITPTVQFISYSPTPITSATVDIYNGTTKVGTQAWTGNVAPYGVGTVNITSSAFTTPPTAFSAYRVLINVAGDAHLTDNVTRDSLFSVYAAANAVATPWSENFEASANTPAKMTLSADALYLFQSYGSYVVTGASGTTTRALLIGFPETSPGTVMEAMLGNFNTGSAADVALDFDVSYANASGTNDKLEIMVSDDCGASWYAAWSKAGAALSTTPPPSSPPYVPTSASAWRHETAVLTSKKGANMMVKVVATAGGGHYGFMDNFKISNTTAVVNVINTNTVSLYPNPARESATLEFTLNNNSTVAINVVDATGRMVSTVTNAVMSAGTQHVTIPTAQLAAGVYNITIQTEHGVLTQRLSVVK